MFETTLRYKSANERNLIEGHPEYYDSILISAHLLAYARGTIPALFRDLAEERDLTYYVDPIVADFRIGRNFRDESGGLRAWHDKYVTELGDPIETILENRSNVHARYLDDDDLVGIAESVVDFQETFVYRQLQDHAGKYEEIGVSQADVQPAAVIPWVHRLEQPSDIEAYRTILEASKRRADRPLRPVLYTSTSAIARESTRAALISLLEDVGVDECYLHFADLDKHDTTESEYGVLIEFVSELARSGIAPSLYYGDFFANLLSYFGLRGVAFSPLHGEQFSEKTDPPGSSGMQSRYYLDEVKDFLQIQAVVDIMTRAGRSVCECEFCQRHFDTWQDLVEADQDEDTALQTVMMGHRVWTRWNHARLVEQTELADVLDELRSDFESFVLTYTTSQQVASRKAFDYLQRWIHAVEDRRNLTD